jgi:AcrR family transcriptional regulator
MKPQPETAKRDRSETERRLVEVALAMMERDGVLGGLNLRKVAEAAGVNRGNIYHYFGTRRELLRSAINSQFRTLVRTLSAKRKGKPFIQRRLDAFGLSDSTKDSQLRALLVLDGDKSVDPMPNFEHQLSELRQDVIEGAVHPRHDLEALQVVLSAVLRGYRIFRHPYARRLGISTSQLDERVTATLAGVFRHLALDPNEAPKSS